MKRFYTVGTRGLKRAVDWPTYISALVIRYEKDSPTKFMVDRLGNFDSLNGETGLIEYIRTHYTREDGSQLTIDDIKQKL